MKDLKPTYTVTNDDEHAALIEQAGALMKKGEANVTADEKLHIRAMAEALMEYEKNAYPIPEPSTFEEFLERRMYDMKREGKDLAQTLGISQKELEMIIWEDHKPDPALLEVIKTQLDIPGDLVLNYA
ncbi:transcriptional regulator [Dyadobacter jiangsuensis]